jgi:hypothetical protein
MNDASNTASDDIQADEETFTSTVSDEALEAAAGGGMKGGQVTTTFAATCTFNRQVC